MTRYEELRIKANRCRMAAARSENELLKKEWMNKANALEIEAGNLPLTQASKKINKE